MVQNSAVGGSVSCVVMRGGEEEEGSGMGDGMPEEREGGLIERERVRDGLGSEWMGTRGGGRGEGGGWGSRQHPDV